MTKAYEIYQRIRDKAEEVKDAINAVASLMRSGDEWDSSNTLIEHFKIRNRLDEERDIEKDTRRSVRVLFEDYCRVRDELINLLRADVGQIAPLKVELELPDGDSRSAKVQWSEMEGDILHLCISVTDRAP